MLARYATALGLLLATAAASATDAPPQQHVAFARAALASLPVPKADRTGERAELRQQQLDAFALELARVSATAPRSPRVWTALLATVGGHESNFDTQLVLGLCKPWQCDHGRAKGAFQNQRVSFTADLWPHADGDIAKQVAMADRSMRRSLTRCERFAPYPAHVFRAYRGGGEGSCTIALRDEAARVATYERLVRLQVKP
jgi:hypothetical protein